MSRIDSDKINVGNSFVVKIENDESENNLVNVEKMVAEKTIECVQLVENAELEAQTIINDAKVQAASEAGIVAEKLKKEAIEKGYKTGYDEGYQSGFKTGYAQAASETTASIKQSFIEKLNLFNSFIMSIFDIKKKVIKSLHVELTALITELVDSICFKKNSIDNKILALIIQQAISKLQESNDEEITLIINQKMKQKVTEALDFINASDDISRNIRLIVDNSLAIDGVIVESMKERIDATFSSHIKNIVSKIMEESDSFSEDNLVLEYNDSFSEIIPQEEKIKEAAVEVKQETIAADNFVSEIVATPPVSETVIEDLYTQGTVSSQPEFDMQNENDTVEYTQNIVSETVLVNENPASGKNLEQAIVIEDNSGASQTVTTEVDKDALSMFAETFNKKTANKSNSQIGKSNKTVTEEIDKNELADDILAQENMPDENT